MKTIMTLLLLSTNLHADEIKCIIYNRNAPVSAIEKLAGDCVLQKSLATDEGVQYQHRKTVYDKLSKELANQIKQNSEDISILTNFYNSNGQDLMMNSKDIADNCRLDNVKAIESCGGRSSGAFKDLKLSLLKNKITKS